MWYSDFSDQFFTIDPTSGSSIGSVTLTSPDGGVTGGNGLAVQPSTNTLYAILNVQDERQLATIDPATGTTVRFGDTDALRGFAGIA